MTSTALTTPRTERRPAGLFALALACFVFSGASGLVYQVVWVRMMGLVFGATALAISTVLASYMAGLALGSYLFGRYIDRHPNPLRVYGILELAIGGFAIVLPAILAALNHLYRPLYAQHESATTLLNSVRFALSFLVILLPTTLMGGTLPVLARFLAGGWSTLGQRIGALYAANTFGAVLGTFMTGFFLIPGLGLKGSVAVAVAANAVVGLIALYASRQSGAMRAVEAAETGDAPARGAPAARPEPPVAPRGGPRGTDLAVLGAFAASGFAALVLEVVWTRFLALVLGTTVYAFTTMLTTFLLGIALGSLIVSRVLDRVRNLVGFLGWMLAGMGLTALVTLYLFNSFPEFFLQLFWKVGAGWWKGTAIKFLLAMGAMLVPCLFMGTTFPIVTKIYARDLGKLGGRIGVAYACNTVGAILGSLAGGFVLLPHLGMEIATVLAAVIAIGVGLLLLGPASPGRMTAGRAVPAGALAAMALFLVAFRPPLDPLELTRGVYDYAPDYHDLSTYRREMKENRLRFYREESDGIVSVDDGMGCLSMRVNGKVDASTSLDMATQVSIAHLALAAHRDPQSVLIVGLGSGVTVGSVEQHPVKTIECVEISPAVIEGSHEFDAVNHSCLGDPRLRMIHADGRNHLLLTSRRYDVILSQPSNPWISGIGYLFTREAFEIVRDRLNPGGLLCQWFHSYQMSPESFNSIIRTMQEVFPHLTLWMTGVGDVIMLASSDPLPPSWERVVQCYSIPGVRRDLARIGMDSPASFLSLYLLDSERIPTLIGTSARLHTDDNLLLEFRAARDLYAETQSDNLGALLRGRELVLDALSDGDRVPAEIRADLERRFRARGDALAAVAERSRGIEETVTLAREAYRIAPDDPLVKEVYNDQHYQLGTRFLRMGQAAAAVPELERAATPDIAGPRFMALQNLGAAYAATRQWQEALLAFGEGLAIVPWSPDMNFNRAQVLAAMGRSAEAMEAFRTVLEHDPDRSEALNNLAWAYAEADTNLAEAERMARRACELEPSAGNYDTLGWVYFRKREFEQARNALRKSLEIAPGQVDAYYHLGMTCRALGKSQEAREALQQVIARDRPDGRYRKEAEAELAKIGAR